jgi:hypothetical protein
MTIDSGADAVGEDVDTPGLAVRLRECLTFDVLPLDEALGFVTSEQHHVDGELESTSIVVGFSRRVDSYASGVEDVCQFVARARDGFGWHCREVFDVDEDGWPVVSALFTVGRECSSQDDR